MPIAGLVGGLGPESTIDYYRRILQEWRRAELGGAPSLMIDSLDAQYVLQLVQQNHAALAEYLLESVGRLAAAGADFAAITANTPHIVFDQLASRSPVPLISIVDVCAAEARTRGFGHVALLGTRFTMEAPFYRAVFAQHGVNIVSLSEADKAVIHAIYTSELLEGVFLDESRQLVHTIVESLMKLRPVDAVVLGGTELPLLLQSDIVGGVPALNTTALHAAAIVARLRAPGSPLGSTEAKEVPALPGAFDPFNGTWVFSPGESQWQVAAPVSWVREIRSDGQRLYVREQIVDAGGDRFDVSVDAAFDSRQAPVRGSSRIDTVQYSRPTSLRIEGTAMRNGRVAFREEAAVDHERGMMTMIVWMVGERGRVFPNTSVFRRQDDANAS